MLGYVVICVIIMDHVISGHIISCCIISSMVKYMLSFFTSIDFSNMLILFEGYVHEVYHAATRFFREAVRLQVFICLMRKIKTGTTHQQILHIFKRCFKHELLNPLLSLLLTFADDPV